LKGGNDVATVQETIESGIIPIVIEMNDVVFFESSERLSRTFLTINSLDLGVLSYNQYRYVARRTKQANQLAERHFTKLMRIIPTLVTERPEISCYIVPVYAKLLKSGELTEILLKALSLYPDAYAGRVCIELSSDILYEDLEQTRAAIEQIRSMGFRIAISEVGDEYCPIFRLAELPFNYIFLDDFAVKRLAQDEGGERVVGGLISYLKGLGAQVFAPDAYDGEIADALRRAGCDGCIGSVTAEPEDQELPNDAESAEDTEFTEDTESVEETEFTEESEPAEDTEPTEDTEQPQKIEPIDMVLDPSDESLDTEEIGGGPEDG
jgi:EAL domain-containing protein (putative c-di-GMP-specific phosphodiesterase class I)